MEFYQTNKIQKNIKYFEKDLSSIMVDYIKASGITILPLAVRALFCFLNGNSIKNTASIFFTDRDILIILVSVVSSAAFVSYKYLKRGIIYFFCWMCTWLSFGVYSIMPNTGSINMYRGIMWFLFSMICSFLNIFASQYIPKKWRKPEC